MSVGTDFTGGESETVSVSVMIVLFCISFSDISIKAVAESGITSTFEFSLPQEKMTKDNKSIATNGLYVFNISNHLLAIYSSNKIE